MSSSPWNLSRIALSMTQNNPTVSAIIFATQHDDWSETALVMLSLNRDSRIIGETRVKTTWTIVKPLYRYHVNGNADIMGLIAGFQSVQCYCYIYIYIFHLLFRRFIIFILFIFPFCCLFIHFSFAFFLLLTHLEEIIRVRLRIIYTCYLSILSGKLWYSRI